MNQYHNLFGKLGTVIQLFPGQAYAKVRVESEMIVANYDRDLVELAEQDQVKIISLRFGYYVIIPVKGENQA